MSDKSQFSPSNKQFPTLFSNSQVNRFSFTRIPVGCQYLKSCSLSLTLALCLVSSRCNNSLPSNRRSSSSNFERRSTSSPPFLLHGSLSSCKVRCPLFLFLSYQVSTSLVFTSPGVVKRAAESTEPPGARTSKGEPWSRETIAWRSRGGCTTLQLNVVELDQNFCGQRSWRATMMVQYSKFLRMGLETSWRSDVSALTYIETSTWTRQEHNGYSHQNVSVSSSFPSLVETRELILFSKLSLDSSELSSPFRPTSLESTSCGLRSESAGIRFRQR